MVIQIKSTSTVKTRERGGRRARSQLEQRLAAAGARPSKAAGEAPSEAEDVIDLGRPRPRRRAPHAPRPPPPLYTPNPRLYPGVRPRPKAKAKAKKAKEGSGRGRRRKRVFRRPVPNARLYRPAPARPAPPPARPRAAWPPPAPPARALDTASRAALRLSEQRPARAPLRPPSPARARSPPSQRLVVTLPGEPLPRYRPASEHFRLRALDTDSGASSPPAARMEPAARAATEDGSDGADTLSAPSEFLAEFLSAIMRRQYAEALKYCRLILQYEPHNATARGFYPLLQHKMRAPTAPPVRPDNTFQGSGSVSDAAGPEGSEGSQSSLEMDSPRSSPSLSPAPPSDSVSGASGTSGTSGMSGLSGTSVTSGTSGTSGKAGVVAASGASSRWGSSASSRSDRDDNGNAPPRLASLRLRPGDIENDNAAASGEPHPVPVPVPVPVSELKSQSAASLRRLREQFACSIK